ncbi:tripartite tricarboxylate transporter TctB family protein [Achromobacter sp. GG226]|uniref:tripartite tricarboxylate transporter TctB family protein n=1 Tax=Verticiella alkaliphila TaxID=2779529 RepID=UPI001C0C0E45|nr:tripartite tricarboxylate transporter TctB family protein [Verticiella sp. GG226]MBU4611755.1 tripartite tricarboxylate transporter TctB family protein [Verticiella sp. GG226]
MRRVDYRDLIGGVLITLAGIGTMYHSLTAFQVGTLARMGPGYFPALVSGLLILCGLIIMIPAFFRAGVMPKLEMRPLVFISLSVLAFALLLVPFGMIPAIIVQTLLSGMADSKLSWKGSLVLAASVAILATLIFKVGLGLIVPVIAWPW